MSQQFTPPPMPGYGPPVAPPPPKGPRTALIATAAAVVAAVIASAVTAGVSGDSEAKPAPTVTVTKTAPAAEGEGEGGAESDAGSEPAAEEAGSGDAYSLTDTVAYENDVEVSLSGFGRGVSSDYAAPENTPYVKFTIKVVNNSDATVDANQMTVNCAYGDEGKEGEAIYDDGLDGLPDTRILAGRSLSVPWACELPKKEIFLQVEVSPDWESEESIFAGDVK
ncbi:putative secreted protein [Streptomyces davaonensis JCM 4913]|uniref:Putative secreted protein n=1 Tax=Streptomyces davaonensis (strain DSM 101723 / JCM 4913 / KCC S-0913 / 768) TaxID=1214101 RepID=K4QYY4_STRDJ|nr:hypothetical protein [Streptomyces davaonensis]CCK26268.1 putative secreted protein [Streptomyces davaonensis JCM 4913]